MSVESIQMKNDLRDFGTTFLNAAELIGELESKVQSGAACAAEYRRDMDYLRVRAEKAEANAKHLQSVVEGKDASQKYWKEQHAAVDAELSAFKFALNQVGMSITLLK